jgi:hypothetical protein
MRDSVKLDGKIWKKRIPDQLCDPEEQNTAGPARSAAYTPFVALVQR